MFKIFSLEFLDKIFKFLKILAISIFIIAEVAIVMLFLNKNGLIEDTPKVGKVNIATINIDKPITTDYVNTIMKKMDYIKDNPKLFSGALITFNSPGGNPAASEELSYYIDDFQKKVSTTFYISSAATSGAYMIACVSDSPLYSAPSTMIGSVGVYVEVWSAESFLKEHGIKSFSDKMASHPDKIPFSIAKDPNEYSINYVQNNLVKPIYANFFNFVKDQRNLNVDVLTKYAEGRVFIASETVGVLVDEIKPLHAVKDKIREKYKKDEVNFVTTNLESQNKGLFNPSVELDLNLQPSGISIN